MAAIMDYKRLKRKHKEALELASRQHWALLELEAQRRRSALPPTPPRTHAQSTHHAGAAASAPAGSARRNRQPVASRESSRAKAPGEIRVKKAVRIRMWRRNIDRRT